jgi:hypothetical protein
VKQRMPGLFTKFARIAVNVSCTGIPIAEINAQATRYQIEAVIFSVSCDAFNWTLDCLRQ